MRFLRIKWADLLGKKVIYTVATTLVSVWLIDAYFVFQFEKNAPGANITSYGEAVWWGIVTLLTIGYGDRYPVTPEGRILAGFLMTAGVLATGIITAKISSYFLEQALKEGRGFVNSEKLKNHFVICGWKDDMAQLLSHILDFNQELKSDDLVLIANIPDNFIESLKSEPRLKDLHVIVGDYFMETNLKRAAPDRARKVLILADRTPKLDGSIPSLTEVDARTVMTAMTLNSLARGTLVTAEILDSKMDHYLKLAHVSEIIYSRDYSRLLLGNASGGTGIANVVFDLLDPKTPSLIMTLPTPENMVHKTYSELKTHIEEKHDKVVIGVLENSGNQHRIKEFALRKAQQTPDMTKLVANLRAVKELRCNNPIFNPSPDYIVPEGSMVIVIETRSQGVINNEGRNGEKSSFAA